MGEGSGDASGDGVGAGANPGVNGVAGGDCGGVSGASWGGVGVNWLGDSGSSVGRAARGVYCSGNAGAAGCLTCGGAPTFGVGLAIAGAGVGRNDGDVFTMFPEAGSPVPPLKPGARVSL